MTKLKKHLISGLLIWVPIIATLFIISMLFHFINNIFTMLPAQYQPDALIGKHIPGLGIILSVVIIILTGILTNNILGKKLLTLTDRIIHRIPLIRSIYAAAHKLCHSLLSDNSRSFRRVLLVEFPLPGRWMLAFETNDTTNINDTDPNMITVFVPCSPNPTSGFMIFIDKKQVKEINMSIEQAFKMVVSIGVISPDQITPITPTAKDS